MSNIEELLAEYENDVGLEDDDKKPTKEELASTRGDRSPQFYWKRVPIEQAGDATLIRAKILKPGTDLDAQIEKLARVAKDLRFVSTNVTTDAHKKPSSFGEALAHELIAGLLNQPDLKSRLSGLMAPDKPDAGPLLMKKADYAKHVSVSVRKLDDLINQGLPTVGKGRMLRVPVKQADQWMVENLNESDDEIEREARSRARKATKRGR